MKENIHGVSQIKMKDKPVHRRYRRTPPGPRRRNQWEVAARARKAARPNEDSSAMTSRRYAVMKVFGDAQYAALRTSSEVAPFKRAQDVASERVSWARTGSPGCFRASSPAARTAGTSHRDMVTAEAA